MTDDDDVDMSLLLTVKATMSAMSVDVAIILCSFLMRRRRLELPLTPC